MVWLPTPQYSPESPKIALELTMKMMIMERTRMKIMTTMNRDEDDKVHNEDNNVDDPEDDGDHDDGNNYVNDDDLDGDDDNHNMMLVMKMTGFVLSGSFTAKQHLYTGTSEGLHPSTPFLHSFKTTFSFICCVA
ncbi:uncharacterized protein LOC112487507 [Cynoglossus semilaevis]|uniref:uncharacterized protein LOC112487507 n=1 Tax=Cynoglossus semilaevis TaxID=244447 RepID=UPI000D624833|nr:uncharacterized protein LOC112487507 [Cynoglossus semilaevis]